MGTTAASVIGLEVAGAAEGVGLLWVEVDVLEFVEVVGAAVEESLRRVAAPALGDAGGVADVVDAGDAVNVVGVADAEDVVDAEGVRARLLLQQYSPASQLSQQPGMLDELQMGLHPSSHVY